MEAKRYGRYETLRPIAAGGMAQVLLGRALGAGGFQRLVAIKVMHAHIAHDPEFEAMFLDEGRIAAGIHHPNVVATLDVQKDDDGLYMVLEYVAGCSLAALLRRRAERGDGPVPFGVSVKILLDMLAGLTAAHELCGPDGKALRVVHRDISPQNVLLGSDGIVRITDFGVARAESRLGRTREGEVKGKVSYMSPEQLRGNVVDARTDVYAAAVVLWELLTGRRLFRHKNHADLAFAVLEGVRERPRHVRPDVPELLDDACMRALEPHGSRYESAAAFADALARAARASGVTVALPQELGALAREADGGVGELPPLPSSRRSEEPTVPREPPEPVTESVVQAPPASERTRRVARAEPASIPIELATDRIETRPAATIPLAASEPPIVYRVARTLVSSPESPEAAAPPRAPRASLAPYALALAACALAAVAVWIATQSARPSEPEPSRVAEPAAAESAPGSAAREASVPSASATVSSSAAAPVAAIVAGPARTAALAPPPAATSAKPIPHKPRYAPEEP